MLYDIRNPRLTQSAAQGCFPYFIVKKDLRGNLLKFNNNGIPNDFN